MELDGFSLLVYSQRLEPFQEFHVVDFEHFVKLEQVLEQHEDVVAEESSLPAERTVFQLVSDLPDHDHEVFLVLRQVRARDSYYFIFHLISLGLQDRDLQA